MLKPIRLVKNANYIILENYGGIKKGTRLNIVSTLVDAFTIIWRGRSVHIPENIVAIDQPRTTKERKRHYD